MDLVLAWLLFPAVALLVCAGIGLLVQRAAGDELPGALLLPVGMAGVVCATQLTTYWDWSAELTLPLVVALALAGLALGRRRLRAARLDPWAVASALIPFGVLSAPIVLSGDATFAGYTVLGDTSIHFIGADALLELGRDFASLPPSSYEYSLAAYYGANGYPSGGPTAVGALTSLVHLDVAWTFQPFLSLLVGLMALALWSLITPVVESRPLRAGIVAVAAQPALVMAYALQGSVKEVGTAFGVVLVGALIPVWARQAAGGPRRVIPLVVAAAATVGIVGLAGGVWLGPFALGALAIAVADRRGVRRRDIAVAVAVAAALGALLCFQALADLTRYVDVAGGVVTSQAEFGNLLGPLDGLQRFGIWLSGDYRVRANATWTETRVLIWILWVAMALGAWLLVRRRALSVAFFVAVSVLAHAYVMREGSPWADGKALMIVSPALVLLGGLGAALLHRARALLGWALLGLIGLGVLWSNALAYHDVSNAPRERMAELRDIGERIDGRGPTLYPEFEEFAKHFLRHGAPEGPTEGWQRRYDISVGRDGQLVRQGFSVDLDRFTDRYMAEWNTIVLRRGFASSRPPSGFRRTWVGRWYEIWQREPGSQRRLIEHLSLGDFRQPVAEPDCGELRRLGGVARAAGGRLVYAERPPNVLASPAAAEPLPRGWFVDPTDQTALVPRGQGVVELELAVPAAGRYELWIEGSFGRGFQVAVDGRPVGEIAYRLNSRGSAERVGVLDLEAGRHIARLSRGGGSPRPGNGGNMRLLGVVGLAPVDATGLPVRALRPAAWRSLCGRPLDWVEAVRPA